MPLPSADHPRVTCESEPEETPHSSMSGPASPEAIGSPQPPPQAVPTALEILEPSAQMNAILTHSNQELMRLAAVPESIAQKNATLT